MLVRFGPTRLLDADGHAPAAFHALPANGVVAAGRIGGHGHRTPEAPRGVKFEGGLALSEFAKW